MIVKHYLLQLSDIKVMFLEFVIIFYYIYFRIWLTNILHLIGVKMLNYQNNIFSLKLSFDAKTNKM